jgi:hypothetical protein
MLELLYLDHRSAIHLGLVWIGALSQDTTKWLSHTRLLQPTRALLPQIRDLHAHRMLMERPISTTIMVSEISASAIISSLARGVSGAVSAGLSAVAKPKARKR